MDGSCNRQANRTWPIAVQAPYNRTICFNSARRRRGIDQLGIDRLEAVTPGQFAEVDGAIGGLFALRPAAQAAEIVVVDLVDRKRPRVGVPLILRSLLTQT